MSGLATLLKKLGSENGVEIDADELEAIGLSDDDTTEDGPVQDDVLSISIPGRAAGMVELWLGADTTAKAGGVESDGLMWYPIIREGQWALRPGGSGTKKRMPLKVVAGSSKNQRKEIGLADLKAAFDDEAIEHVTVPETHSNTTLENTGFIKGMKIVDGTVKDQKTKKSSKVKVLLGGYDIKLPEVKRKMQLGSVAGRSAGILYDYTNTETGKAQPLDANILTAQGWVQMGDICVGDEVIGSSGFPTEVLAVYPQGERECFRVVFSDGSATECDGEHLWAVRTPVQRYQGKGYQTLTLNEIAARGLHETSGKAKWHVPMTKPVEFDEAELPIHPYLLGALLGDGCLSTKRVLFASAEEEMLELVGAHLPAGHSVVHHSGLNYGIVGEQSGKRGSNEVRSAIHELGLRGSRSSTKFVPEAYKLSSATSRLELLRGLLDTDGYAEPGSPRAEYTTISKQLAEDVRFIVQSLGGRASLKERMTTSVMVDGEPSGNELHVQYRVGVSLPSGVVPFHLARKKAALSKRVRYEPTRAIVAIEPVGQKPAQCIRVAAEDHLYVTDDFVVTHNTYPAVVEHVCLTNKPWITGMLSFGRKLAEGGMNVVGLSLSDEGPSDDEYTLALADELELSEDDQDFLAVAGATWDHETSPAWLQGQVNKILNEARQKKREAKRSANGSYVEESIPYYRCCEAKPGGALISDGYGDEANYWVAPITVEKGVLSLSEFDKWTASKRAYVPDEREAPSKKNLPLDQEDKPDDAPAPSRIKLAQVARRARGAGTNDQPPRGGGNMGNNDGSSTTLELSEVAQAAIQRAETEAREQKERADRLERQIAGLSSTVFSNEADKFISWVASDESGLGLSEKRGFSGFLVELRHTLLADDGEPAVVSDHFADASNSEGTLTLSDVVKRLFNAISTSQKGKKSLGEQLSQPSEEQEVELGADGKPVADGSDGKPAVSLNEKEAEEKLADSEKNQETLLSEIDPRVLKHMGLEIPDAADKLVKKEASIKKEYVAGATLADLAKKNLVAISDIKDLLEEAGVTIRPTTTGKVGAS